MFENILLQNNYLLEVEPGFLVNSQFFSFFSPVEIFIGAVAAAVVAQLIYAYFNPKPDDPDPKDKDP
jgi:hypothetical protein